MVLRIFFMAPDNTLYPLEFEVENNVIAKLWVKKLKKFLRSKSKLETRWTGFNLDRRSPQILLQKLDNCIKKINSSWLATEYDYKIEVETPKEYNTELHNIVHHHFEILMGQVWNKSKWYLLMEQREDWDLINAVRGLNDLSHELEAVSVGKPFLCTTFWDVNGIQKDDLPIEVEDYFQLNLEFGAVYLHYAQLGKTWQEVCWDDDDHIFEENISPFCLLSGEFDVSFGADVLTHEQLVETIKPKLESMGRDVDDKSLRLGRVKVAQLTTNKKQREILSILKKYDQIGYIELDGYSRAFEPYDDPY